MRLADACAWDTTSAGRSRSAAGRSLCGERGREPWSEALARGAAEVADQIADKVGSVVDDPELVVTRLALVYVEGTGLAITVSLGLQDVREYDMGFWYGWEDGDGPEPIDCAVPDELQRRLLRTAALNDPDPPQRTVLHSVAAALARRDWAGVLAPAEDFVVFIAEHDEDVPPKRESLHKSNPPGRAAIWDERFPPDTYEQ